MQDKYKIDKHSILNELLGDTQKAVPIANKKHSRLKNTKNILEGLEDEFLDPNTLNRQNNFNEDNQSAEIVSKGKSRFYRKQDHTDKSIKKTEIIDSIDSNHSEPIHDDAQVRPSTTWVGSR